MGTQSNKKSVMTLYTGSQDIYSHRVRIVLAEKGVQADIIEVDRLDSKCEDLSDLNPYNTVPTLVDRNLVLYESRVIMEYLDERFPHPPLLPVYPVARAKSRLLMHRIERDWYAQMEMILSGRDKKVEKGRKELTESLVSIAPLFKEYPYFLSEEFSMLDCCVAPVLWRLPELGITLPKQAKAVESYAERLFERPSFQKSLTETEQEIRLDLVEEFA